jgi:hypothetical protein
MKTTLTPDEWAAMRREGLTAENVAAMRGESIDEMVEAIARCTVTDPALIDADFSPDGTVSGEEWLDLYGFPVPRRDVT